MECIKNYKFGVKAFVFTHFTIFLQFNSYELNFVSIYNPVIQCTQIRCLVMGKWFHKWSQVSCVNPAGFIMERQ